MFLIILRPTRRRSVRRFGHDPLRAAAGWAGWWQSMILLRWKQRIGRPAIEGHRHLPDGTVLTWHQLGVKDLQIRSTVAFLRALVG